MKAIIKIFVITSVFLSASLVNFASESKTIFEYDRNLNSHISLNLLKSPKKYKFVYIKDKEGNVIMKQKVENDKKIEIDITDFEPGTYFIEANGYREKVVIK